MEALLPSDWVTICDAIISDLTTEVPGLRDAISHRYSEANPEELVSEANERHLAVWPSGEDAETATPFVTAPGGDQLAQAYQILYWEPSSDSQGTMDEEAAADLLELHNAIRARFYKIENLRIGGTSETRYLGARFGTRSGQVRWMQLAVRTLTYITAD